MLYIYTVFLGFKMNTNGDIKGDGLSQFQMSASKQTPEPVAGAMVSVTMLRKYGVKLTRSEREASKPLEGEMTISRFRRSEATSISLEAMLFKSAGPTLRYQICNLLFDPRVISMDARGTAYQGFERETIDGKMHEFVQVWLVKPLTGP